MLTSLQCPFAVWVENTLTISCVCATLTFRDDLDIEQIIFIGTASLAQVASFTWRWQVNVFPHTHARGTEMMYAQKPLNLLIVATEVKWRYKQSSQQTIQWMKTRATRSAGWWANKLQTDMIKSSLAYKKNIIICSSLGYHFWWLIFPVDRFWGIS